MSATVYPVPVQERLYSGYDVTVDGAPAPVSEVRCSAIPFNRRWPGHQRQIGQTELCGMVRFAFEGKATVAVTPDHDFKEVKVRPLSRGVNVRREGRMVTFDIERPGGYSVEFDGYHNNLHVFADAPKDYALPPDAIVFGPGVHDIGIMALKSGDTVFLDPGAIVYGGFHAKDATGVSILGRGILDGGRLKETILFPASGDGNEDVKNAKREHTIDLRNCRDIVIDGPTIRDSLLYNIAMWGCEDVAVSNVKIVGQWRFNTDGIDLHNCRRARVSDCFARTFDDTFCFKAHEGYGNCEDGVFERCVAWNDWGKAFEVGVECRADHLRRLAFRDCDCIHAVGTVMDVTNVDYGRVSEVLFETIRVEADEQMAMPQMQRTDDSPFDAAAGLDRPPALFYAGIYFAHEYSVENGGKWSGGGFIDGVAVRDVTVVTDGRKPYVGLRGLDAGHRPENVVFENLSVNGHAVTDASELVVDVAEGVTPPRFARGGLPERTHAFKTPARMEMLRPGEVRPRGWLRDWCVTARNGYVSRMDEIDKAFPRAWNSDFHPRGKYLDWTDPDKGAWCTEGGAYWFEGLVRLAWELDDADLKAYATKRLEPLLERMNPKSIAFVYWMDRDDPAQMAEIEAANHGFIVGASGRTTRAVLAYWEATGDKRALRALTWCLDDPRFYFFGNPVALPAAACDTWRYTGDGKLAKALDNFYATELHPDRWPAMRYGLPVEPGKVAMEAAALKDWRPQHGVLFYESALSWIKGACWTGDGKFLANILSWMDWTERNCRQPHGVIVADEAYGHPGPSRGTETCVVAGDILAYATLASVTGEGRFADHVERSFFNAGPACVSRDFMRHVYFQSPNRTEAEGAFRHAPGPGVVGGVYKTKHWPLCCTAALARILPGYVQWMWMKPASGGLAATLYAPNTLETALDGVAIHIETKTDYPFGETLEMAVSTASPLRFPLRLRVPGWCANPSFAVNGEALDLSVGDDDFVTIEREWKSGDTMSLRFPMAPRVETMRDFNDGGKPYCSISYGPLLFARGIPELDENTPAPGARTDWRLDSSRVLDGAEVVRKPMPAKWDWPLAAPLRLTVKDEDGVPLELVPYGCAKLRISLFPDSGGIGATPHAALVLY